MKRIIAILLALTMILSVCPLAVFADEIPGETNTENQVTLYRYRNKVYSGSSLYPTDSEKYVYKTESYSDYYKREWGYSKDYDTILNYGKLTLERVQYYLDRYSSTPNLTKERIYEGTGYLYNTWYDGSGWDKIFTSKLTSATTDYSGRTCYEYEGRDYYYRGTCDLYRLHIYSTYYYHYYYWGSWSGWSTTPVEATDERQVETKPGKYITYDANGGNDAPAPIAVGLDANFTISANTPTRKGYQFIGWALTPEGEVAYHPGDTCSAADVTTVYAVWDFTGMISITQMPVKTQYTIGESLDTTGLTILLSSISGGTTTTTQGYTVSGFDSATPGQKTLTVTYEGFTDTFTVWVIDRDFCGGDLTWTYDGAGTLTIAGTGSMSNYSSTDMPWYAYRADIKTVVMEPGLTRIGDYAFSGCTGLTAVSIPDTVTKIGNYAFDGCSKLSKISFGASVTNIGAYAFRKCTQLGSLTISDPVKVIGNYAFASCTNLKNVTIGNSVTSIGSYAFQSCTKLTDVTIGSNVSSIGGSVFGGCSSLVRMTIPFVGTTPASPTSTNQNPFGSLFGTGSYDGCSATEQTYYGWSTSSTTTSTYYIPNSLTTVTVTGGYIPYGAFSNCKNLTNITLGNDVTALGKNAFYNCSKLENITIGSGVTAIGADTFYQCSALKNVYITDLSAWCNIAFSNFYANPLYYTRYAYVNNRLVTDLVIPEGVTQISSYAFYDYENLASVRIPNSVSTIGASAFYYCDNLSDVVYCGTEEQWNSIEIGNSNTHLTRVARVFHNWKSATCTAPQTCTYCNAVQGDPLPHNFGQWAAADDLQHTRTCTCGYEEASDHDWSPWQIKTAATCTQAGEKHSVCLTCGFAHTLTIPATGHTYVSVVTPPSCFAQGFTTHTCQSCADTYTDNYTDADHTGPWMELIAPTCTQSGLQARICDACSATETAVLPATGHNWGEWTQIQAPTCTEKGSAASTCATCGAATSKDLEATGHAWSAWSQTKAPTCTQSGTNSKTCATCGEVNEEEIPATGHTWSAWITVTAPTCAAEGTQMRFCYCGSIESQSAPKTSHSGEGELCDICGQVQSYHWVLTGDRDVAITLSEDLYIDLAGYTVTGTIHTNGYSIHITDSATDTYSCDSIGYFRCQDTNGNAIIPQATANEKGYTYLTIPTAQGYTAHRYDIRITHVNMQPTTLSFGYKAVFYGDDMVRDALDEENAFGYTLQLDGHKAVTVTNPKKDFVSGKCLTLRLDNIDIVNYGQTQIHAMVMLRLQDGTEIFSNVVTYSPRTMLELLNQNCQLLTQTQLASVHSLIDRYAFIREWDVKNLLPQIS